MLRLSFILLHLGGVVDVFGLLFVGKHCPLCSRVGNIHEVEMMLMLQRLFMRAQTLSPLVPLRPWAPGTPIGPLSPLPPC